VANYYEYINLSKYNLYNNTWGLNRTTQQGFNLGNQVPRLDTTSITIETWLQVTSFNSGNKYNNTIAFKEYYQVNGFRFGIDSTSGSSADTQGYPTFWSDQSGSTVNLSTASTSTPISLNRFYQIVFTYDFDTKTAKIYLNGALASTQTNARFNPAPNSSLIIGGNSSGCLSMNGQMGIFRWYNRALNAAEVADNFAGNRVRFGI
jgi:hypothetical protein